MTILPSPSNLNSWAGWIPTVSGQLSFSIIGHSSAAANCAYVNDLLPRRANNDAPARFIALHQYRTAPDYPWPDWITRWLMPGAAQDFVLIAETCEAKIQVNLPRDASGKPTVDAIPNAQGVLSGKIYILLHDRHPRQDNRNKAFVAKLKRLMWQSKSESFDVTKESIVKVIDLWRNSGIPLLEVNFSLFRTGEFRVWLDPKPWKKVIGTTFFDDATKIFPNQIFYFVKDVVHRHYHHNGSSDQMLSLTKASGDFAKSEIDWRRQTLWGLVRVVMQYRRTGRWPDLQKAKGVAAYAEAFQLSFSNCLRSAEGSEPFVPTSKLSTYDFKHIRESIDVSAADRASTRSATWQALTLGVTIVLAVLLAWSSYGSKMLALRLAKCNADLSVGTEQSVNGIDACQRIAVESITGWESLAHSNPLIVIILMSTFLAMIYNPVLRDIPMGESWIGRRWEAVLATLLLFVYSLYTGISQRTQRALALFKWLASQLPLVGLIGIMGAIGWWLRQLIGSL